MKNFEFEHNGQKLWYSRSLACSLIVLRYDSVDKTIEVLAAHRGPGCEFNKGSWNVPGGFIDFDEDSKQCAIRETFEETGVKVPENQVEFRFLDTTPRGFRQTMVAVHGTVIPKISTKDWVLSTENSEPGEVTEVCWIDLNNLKHYNWTRGQIENIKKVIQDYDWVLDIVGYNKYKDFVN